MVTKKIKVLYVADTFLPKRDGVVRYMLETAKRFSENIELTFLVPNFPGAREGAEKLKLKAQFCPIMKFKIVDYPPTKPRVPLIKKALVGVDIVCIQSIAPLGAVTLLQAKKAKKKTIEVIHSLDWKLLAYATRLSKKTMGLLKPITRHLYNKNDLLVVADERIKAALRSIGVKADIKVIPLGVDIKKFKKDRQKRVHIRRKLKLTDKFVIGYCGRLSPEKNLRLLLKALQAVKKEIPNVVFLAIGGGAQESLFRKKKDVIVVGFVDNPEDYLQAVDLFVLPSKTETTGLSLMEAMAVGLPSIASAVGAIPSYVKSGSNGILIDKESLTVETLARTILKLYHSPRLRISLAQAAERTIKKFYSWDKTTKELEKTFKQIIKK